MIGPVASLENKLLLWGRGWYKVPRACDIMQPYSIFFTLIWLNYRNPRSHSRLGWRTSGWSRASGSMTPSKEKRLAIMLVFIILCWFFKEGWLHSALFGNVYRTIFPSKRRRVVFKTGVIMYNVHSKIKMILIKHNLKILLSLYLHMFIFVIELMQNMNIFLWIRYIDRLMRALLRQLL